MTQRVVVVGVDGSDGSVGAVRWCADTAVPLDARVVAVCVLEPPVYLIPPTGVGAVATFDEGQHADVAALLDREWCAPLRDAGVAFESRVVDGSPAWELEAVADELHADLIVVGRRGRGGLIEMLLGSVAHRLAHHAARPVVIVPASTEVS